MKRFGLLIPSSNVVLEPLAQKVKDKGTIHISRLEVLDVKMDNTSRGQFELKKQVSAARLLSDAKVNVIIWGGTSASWLGIGTDLRFIKELHKQTGISAGSCVLEINRQLAALGARRLGIVTPYTAEVTNQITQNYKSLGFQVVATAHDNGEFSNDFASIPQQTIAHMIRTVAVAQPDAIIIMCTNVAGAALAQTMQKEMDCPIIDSASATLAAFDQF